MMTHGHIVYISLQRTEVIMAILGLFTEKYKKTLCLQLEKSRPNFVSFN